MSAGWELTLTEPPLNTCVVAYFDLLGYGTMLQAASCQLTHPVAALAVKRIRDFHGSAQVDSLPNGVRIRKLNDAIVATRDLDRATPVPFVAKFDELNPISLSPRGAKEYWEFLEWARDLHDRIRRDQRRSGYPGARTVACIGERLADPDGDNLTLNMAFATAYLAEGQGTKAGLFGDFFYVQWLSYALALPLAGRVPPSPPDLVMGVRVLGRDHSFLRCIPRAAGQARGEKGTHVTIGKELELMTTDIFGDPMPPA